MNTLVDKTALVTGGSRGIGAGIVHRLAREGADVGFTYRNDSHAADEVAAKVGAAGRRGVAIQAENADPGSVRAAVDRTAAELGGLDVLVNSAGTLPFKPIQEFTDAEFDEQRLHRLIRHTASNDASAIGSFGVAIDEADVEALRGGPLPAAISGD